MEFDAAERIIQLGGPACDTVSEPWLLSMSVAAMHARRIDAAETVFDGERRIRRDRDVIVDRIRGVAAVEQPALFFGVNRADENPMIPVCSTAISTFWA